MEGKLAKKLNIFSMSTNDVCVEVRSEYLKEHSDPEAQQFVWAYHVTIKNTGNDTVQILSRHWKIADSNGETLPRTGVVVLQPAVSSFEHIDSIIEHMSCKLRCCFIVFAL